MKLWILIVFVEVIAIEEFQLFRIMFINTFWNHLQFNEMNKITKIR